MMTTHGAAELLITKHKAQSNLKISIVTAVLNREETIGEAIASVQGQTYSNIEHMIQDGGSSDRTLEIIERMKQSNTCLESVKDEGIYDAINQGIKRSTGDIIGLMHSDDFYAHNHILTHVAELFETQNLDGLYGDIEYVSYDNPNHVVRHWRSGNYDYTALTRGWMPPHPSVYLRREVFERFGFYDSNFKIAGDYEAMLRILTQENQNIGYLPEVMVKMRLGGISNGSLLRVLLKTREDLRAIKRHKVGGLGTLALKNLRKINQFRVLG